MDIHRQVRWDDEKTQKPKVHPDSLMKENEELRKERGKLKSEMALLKARVDKMGKTQYTLQQNLKTTKSSAKRQVTEINTLKESLSKAQSEKKAAFRERDKAKRNYKNLLDGFDRKVQKEVRKQIKGVPEDLRWEIILEFLNSKEGRRMIGDYAYDMAWDVARKNRGWATDYDDGWGTSSS
jgi:chromosome segregation ATPase